MLNSQRCVKSHILRLGTSRALCSAELVTDWNTRNFISKTYGAIRSIPESDLCPDCVEAVESESSAGARMMAQVRTYRCGKGLD